MTGLVQTYAPDIEPVESEEAMAYLRIDNEEDYDLVDGMIVTAREACEAYTGRALISQEWTLWLDGPYPPPVVALPRAPLIEVVEVARHDETGTAHPLDPAAYFVDTAGEPGRLVLRVAVPAGRAVNALSVRFRAGYGENRSAVPRALRQGMLAHIAALYEARGDTPSPALPALTEGLYRPFRLLRI